MDDHIKRGYHEPAMKRKALRLAQTILRTSLLTASRFKIALNAIQSLEQRKVQWRGRVESAYARLPKAQQRSARFTILDFYMAIRDYQAARCFLPKRFSGPCFFHELAYAMEVLLHLNCFGEAELLVPKCLRVVQIAAVPEMRASLLCSIGEYFAATVQSGKAFDYFQAAEQHEPGNLWALRKMVDARIAQALGAATTGIKKLHKLKDDPDKALELTASGFARDEWEFKVREMTRIRNLLQTLLEDSAHD